MSSWILFAVIPYAAFAIALLGSIHRYRHRRHSITARSSQLLESRVLRWASLAWHPSILCILLVHLLATLIPGPWDRLLGSPSRLVFLEVTGLALGLVAFLGVATLLVRRFSLRHATGPLDWLVLSLLLIQVGTGVYVAWVLRWGGAWYLHTASPWLASLATFSPRVETMVVLPAVVKFHAINAFVLVALLPLTRLIHLTILPLSYLWRPPQLVFWKKSLVDRRQGGDWHASLGPGPSRR